MWLETFHFVSVRSFTMGGLYLSLKVGILLITEFKLVSDLAEGFGLSAL